MAISRHAMPVGMIVGALLMLSGPSAFAQDKLPPTQMFKTMADANKSSGWVAFREYDGHQWVYFTPVVTLHCGLSEIRYSINSPALDQRFPLPVCHPDLPFSLPPDAGPEAIALKLEPHHAEKLAIQLVFADGSESEILVFEPCTAVGEATCARLMAD